MGKRTMRAEDLGRLVLVGDPQISPDGSRVLFTRKTVNAKNKTIANLVSVDLEGSLQEWTQGEGGNSGGRWSPDGSQILFVSGREKPAPQLHLLSLNGGEAKAVSKLPEGSIGEYKWSPDGTQVAFLFRHQVPSRTEKAKKEREENGLSEPPKEIDSVWYRLDGDGYFENQRYELYVLDVATGRHTMIYDEAIDGNYGFDWRPDGQGLVVIHTANADLFISPPNDQLFLVDLEGVSEMVEGLPKGEKSNPKWSPDGRSIAYTGDTDEQDPWGTRNAKLYLLDVASGEVSDLTGHQDHDLAVATLSDTKEAGFGSVVEWAPDSKSIYVQVGTKGEQQLGRVSIETGGVELLTEGHHVLTVGNLSRDGRRVAAIYGDPVRVPEVAVVEPELATGRFVPRLLTDLNHDFHEEVEVIAPQEHWVETTDGLKVHAWTIFPAGYEEKGRYPAVLEIHGGPHTQYGWAFFHEFQLLAAKGFLVVYSNPRGSKGYGEDWCRAIQGDWGNKDWDDVQSVTRFMQHHPNVHPGQMGVMGGSYGGYMTNWVIGHCHDFAAAITDRCVSNMVSMAGNSDFPFNKDGYFKGVAWGSLEDIRELWRQSPIASFTGVKTPTLVIHSEGDLRCNVEQGEQVFSALQMQGVPSRFVRYPSSTFHGMSRNGPTDLRLHRLGEIVRWMETWLKK